MCVCDIIYLYIYNPLELKVPRGTLASGKTHIKALNVSFTSINPNKI